jgi:hypothetical protein
MSDDPKALWQQQVSEGDEMKLESVRVGVRAQLDRVRRGRIQLILVTLVGMSLAVSQAIAAPTTLLRTGEGLLAGGFMLLLFLGWRRLAVASPDTSKGSVAFRSFVGFDKVRRVGVVVLVDTANDIGGDDIAMHLLTGAPLSRPKAERLPVVLDAPSLARLVGRYQPAPAVTITITRKGSQLFAQLTGQSNLEIFAEGPTDVFWKAVEAQAHFEVAPDGQITGLVLRQNGRNLPAPRLP